MLTPSSARGLSRWRNVIYERSLLAIVVFIGMPAAMELLGGGAVTMAELRRLVGVTTLDVWGYFLLGIVVLVIAALCMVTSRIGVYRILNSQH